MVAPTTGRRSGTNKYFHYKNWAYVAINAWVRELAGGDEQQLGDIHYKKVRKSLQKHLHKKPIVKAFGGPQANEEYQPWPHDHPMCELLAHPNELDVSYDLWAWHIIFKKLTGESHWWVIRNEWDIPVEIWVIPTHWKRLVCDGNGLPSHYYVQSPWGQMMEIPYGDVVSFYEHSPLNRYEGFGPTQAFAEQIDSYEQLTRSRLATWLNNGVPSLHIQLGEGYGDPDEQFLTRFYSRWFMKFGGSDNVNKPLITGPDVTIKGVDGHRPADLMMATNQSEEQIRDETLALFGVPKAIVGLVNEMTYGSVEASIDAFREYNINAELKYTGQVITHRIIRPTPGWEDGICFWNDRATGNSEFRLKKQEQDLNLGVRTIEEIRTEDGLAPYPHGGQNPMLGGVEMPWVVEEPVVPEGAHSELEAAEEHPGMPEGAALRSDGMLVDEGEGAPKSLRDRINKRKKRIVRKVQPLPDYIELTAHKAGPTGYPTITAIDTRTDKEVGYVWFRVEPAQYTRDQHGKPVLDREEKLVAGMIKVDSGYRRQGIASAMYDLAEREFGKITPSSERTRDGQAFWQDRRQVRSVEKSLKSRKVNKGPLAVSAEIKYELRRLGCSPRQANEGQCAKIASRIANRIPGAAVRWGASNSDEFDFHAFIEYEGRYYDAEAPAGVSRVEDLPFFRRFGLQTEDKRFKRREVRSVGKTKITGQAFRVVVENGYAKVYRKSDDKLICAGTVLPDGRLTDITFMDEKFRRDNPTRQAAMTCLQRAGYKRLKLRALGESSGAAGGYLVPPNFPTRDRTRPPLQSQPGDKRGLFSRRNGRTNTI